MLFFCLIQAIKFNQTQEKGPQLPLALPLGDRVCSLCVLNATKLAQLQPTGAVDERDGGVAGLPRL